MTSHACSGMTTDLLHQHIDHNLTRPTLLAGPDGCGKTEYARRVLAAEGFDIIEVAGDGDMLETLDSVMCGKGFSPRGVIITEFEIVVKDKALNWKKFTELLLKLTKKKVALFAIADWSLNIQGQTSQRYPPDLKKMFYIVTVKPPSPSQICEILQRHNINNIKPYELSKLANDCCGDVRHALIACRTKGKTMKDMHINSDVDDRMRILLSTQRTYNSDLVDLSMLSILFDNYLNLPLTFDKSCKIADSLSLGDVFICAQEHNLVYAVVQTLGEALSSGGASKFMNSKRDNTASLVANRQKLLRTERNKLLNHSTNITLEYLMSLPILLDSTQVNHYGLTTARLEKLHFKFKNKKIKVPTTKR